jgi:hypothetical protein
MLGFAQFGGRRCEVAEQAKPSRFRMHRDSQQKAGEKRGLVTEPRAPSIRPQNRSNTGYPRIRSVDTLPHPCSTIVFPVF